MQLQLDKYAAQFVTSFQETYHDGENLKLVLKEDGTLTEIEAH